MARRDRPAGGGDDGARARAICVGRPGRGDVRPVSAALTILPRRRRATGAALCPPLSIYFSAAVAAAPQDEGMGQAPPPS